MALRQSAIILSLSFDYFTFGSTFKAIKTKTPFAVDPHEKMLNGTRPSASLYERSIYERTFISEPIENDVIKS